VDATVRAAQLGSADQAAAAGLISAHAAALTKGALHTMSPTRWTLTAAVVLALGLLGGAASLAHRAAAVEPHAPAPAGEDAEPGQLFRLRFHEGRPFYQEVTTTTRQTLKVMGQGVNQDQRQTFYFRWTPAERRPDGGWVLMQRLEGVKMDLDIGGNKIEFDSTRGGSVNNALTDFYKALLGSEFRVTLDRRFKVRKVESGENLLQKREAALDYIEGRKNLLEKPQAARGFAPPAASPTAALNWEPVPADIERFFPALPEEPVRPGDSWARKNTVDIGTLGTYQATHVYTYEGREGNLDRISVETTLKDRPLPAKDGGLPFAVKDTKLDRASGTGTILFDSVAGRVVRMDLELSLEGPMTIAIGREEAGVELGLKQHITVKTTDANPLKETPPPDDSGGEIERLRQENARLKRQLKAVEDALRGTEKPKD
jgi:hypothetical protein